MFQSICWQLFIEVMNGLVSFSIPGNPGGWVYGESTGHGDVPHSRVLPVCTHGSWPAGPEDLGLLPHLNTTSTRSSLKVLYNLAIPGFNFMQVTMGDIPSLVCVGIECFLVESLSF